MSEKEKVTAEEAMALFDAVVDAEDKVEAAKADVLTAEEKVSEAIEVIHEKLGSGPFSWKGKTVRVSKRKGLFSLREVEPAKILSIG